MQITRNLFSKNWAGKWMQLPKLTCSHATFCLPLTCPYFYYNGKQKTPQVPPEQQ